ncbi:hypothetical protein PJI17_20325 [Mycobacterium kansasii]
MPLASRRSGLLNRSERNGAPNRPSAGQASPPAQTETGAADSSGLVQDAPWLSARDRNAPPWRCLSCQRCWRTPQPVVDLAEHAAQSSH